MSWSRPLDALTSSDPSAVLPANCTFVAADNGIHVLGLTLKTVGTQTVTATAASHDSITAVQTVSAA